MSVLQKHHCVEFLVRALFFKEKIYFFLKYIHACVGVGVREKERDREEKGKETESAGAVQAEGAIQSSGARTTGSYNCLE